MPPMKKSTSKFISNDIDDSLTDSEYLNGSPKNKKKVKRQQPDTLKADVSNLSDTNSAAIKKKKNNESIEVCGESRQKTLNLMSQQLDARKHINEKMFKNLSEAIEDFEADYNALKENEQKLEHLIGSFLKCVQQSTTAYKQKLKSFKELHTMFKKKYDEIDTEQRGEMDKLGGELEQDVYNLKQKLILETKRSEWENLQKYFMKAMHNNF